MRKLLIALFLLTFLGAFPGVAHGVAVYEISDGTVKSLWHMESSSVDTIGTNNGTDNTVSYGAGQLGNGATFSGSPSSITASNTNFPTTGPVWEHFWIKRTGAAGLYAGFGYGTATINNYFGWYGFNGTDTNYTIDTFGGDCGFTVSAYGTTWHMVDITYPGSGTTVTAYLDGSSLGTCAIATALSSVTGTSYFAKRANGTLFLPGMMDDVAVVNKTPSASDITALWNGGTGAEICVTSGCGGGASSGPTMLVMWWDE